MNRSVLLRAASVFSVVAAMVPFMFALIRAVTTGSDIRYFWMALAAALGAVVVSVTAGRGRTSARVFGPAVTALLLATLLAGLTGYMLGARASVGIWIVAVAFGLCDAASLAFWRVARPRAEVTGA